MFTFVPELAGAAIFNMTEYPVEIGHAVEAAGEADFCYAPSGACHKFFSFGHPLLLNRLDKCHSRLLLEDM